MARFQKGQSGNPAGRPPKSRALADLLEKALAKSVATPDGKVAGKRLLARLVVNAITTGQVPFPLDDKPSTLGVKDWMEFVKWAYQYLDPTPTKLEHTGEDGGPIPVAAVSAELLEKLKNGQ